MSIYQMLFPNAPNKHEPLTLADLGKRENLVMPQAYIHPRFPEAADFFIKPIKKINPAI